MPILFVGSSVSDFKDSSAATVMTTPTTLAPGADEGFKVFNSSEYCRNTFAPVEHFWCTFYEHYTSPFGTRSNIVFGFAANGVLTGLDYSRFYIQLVGNGGTAYLRGVSIGTFTIVENQVEKFDIRYRSHATNGLIEIYKNDVLILSFSGDTRASNGSTLFNAFGFVGAEGGVGRTYSSVILATSDTRVMLVRPLPIVGQGSINEWEGDYTQVNQPGLATTNFIWTDEVGAVTLFNLSKPAIPAGHFVGAIVISGYNSLYGDEFEGIKAVQLNSQDQVVQLGEIPTTEITFGGNQFIAEVNPTTGVRYTPTEFANFEFGLQSF